ncbi:MAG: putative hydroxymethylpyrimidine transporter CytX [Deltaproteobacteria bacterium]|nr:MAG: putative hydroxymethylpyrimidine transporter CytX [Deltaproteobacteria bacterium]
MQEEGYSIKPVKKRIFTFFDIFAIWLGAGISIAEFWAGALLTPALPLLHAILIIIIGHIIGNLIMALVAIPGCETGLPTMVLARAAMGVKGSVLPSLLNYIQLIGWTAIMLIVGARAMDAVFGGYYHAWIAILGIIVTAWAFVTPSIWRKLEKISAILLLLLSIWLTYVTINRFSMEELFNYEASGDISIMLALDLVIAMPLSWTPLVADYARFGKEKRAAFWATFTGYFISSSLFYFIGSLTNAAIGEADPIGIIASYGIGIPAMLIIVFSTATTTFLDVYSAAITFKNIRPRSNARLQIILVGIAGILLAMFLPMEKYESFLLLIGGAFVSLTAILIADYFVVKRGYDAKEFFVERGKYWYSRGYNHGAILSWFAGFVFYILLASEGLLGYSIPVFSEIGRAGSSIPTFILVFLLYYILAKITESNAQ